MTASLGPGDPPIAAHGQAIEPRVSTGERTQKLLAAGGILAALGAASCCVMPFALFVLGISGAWIGNLTALEPYQPIFATIAAASIGYGFYLVYRQPKAVCADGSYCASPRSLRLTKAGLWVAAILVVIALGFPRLAPLFL
jgi:mercuric ion transport protein